MLDPGHGGTNLGAPATDGRGFEKTATLAIAGHAAALLRRQNPTLKVSLTRERDTYLTLQQRVRAANTARADLFLSIHLNASPFHNQQGFVLFLLGRQASDDESAALAERENDGKHRVIKGKKIVSSILGQLRRTAAHTGAALLAGDIRRALAQTRGKAADRGLRQANFDVLKGLTMPGVLVEVGFIDHPEEGQDLLRPETQKAIGEALARGISARLKAKWGRHQERPTKTTAPIRPKGTSGR